MRRVVARIRVFCVCVCACVSFIELLYDFVTSILVIAGTCRFTILISQVHSQGEN